MKNIVLRSIFFLVFFLLVGGGSYLGYQHVEEYLLSLNTDPCVASVKGINSCP